MGFPNLPDLNLVFDGQESCDCEANQPGLYSGLVGVAPTFDEVGHEENLRETRPFIDMLDYIPHLHAVEAVRKESEMGGAELDEHVDQACDQRVANLLKDINFERPVMDGSKGVAFDEVTFTTGPLEHLSLRTMAEMVRLFLDRNRCLMQGPHVKAQGSTLESGSEKAHLQRQYTGLVNALLLKFGRALQLPEPVMRRSRRLCKHLMSCSSIFNGIQAHLDIAVFFLALCWVAADHLQHDLNKWASINIAISILYLKYDSIFESAIDTVYNAMKVLCVADAMSSTKQSKKKLLHGRVNL